MASISTRTSSVIRFADPGSGPEISHDLPVVGAGLHARPRLQCGVDGVVAVDRLAPDHAHIVETKQIVDRRAVSSARLFVLSRDFLTLRL